MRPIGLIASFVAALIVTIVVPAAAQSPQSAAPEKRIALVIGNSGYQFVPRLANPTSDARLMAETLRALGFTLIGDKAQEDLDKQQFDQAVQAFGNQIQGASVALFYYAGHGIQLNGNNYLVPVSANPTREADVDFQMVGVQLVLHQMEESGSKLNLVILDACRNSPFGGRGLRSTGSGLAQMQAPTGTLISYATQPGNVAADGADGHSPYTEALVAAVHEPGRGIFDVFNQVGLKVMASTAGVQQPWLASSPIEGQFFFVPPGDTQAPQQTQTAMVVPAPPLDLRNDRSSRIPPPQPQPQPESTAEKDCDALAASPLDKSRPADVPGVLFARIDAVHAEPACRQAVQQHPSPRLYFQLGRALLAAHDDAEAARDFRLAADQGVPDALHDLALLYRDGRGVAQSDAEAVRLLRLSADQGFTQAQFRLGVMYREGRGVAQSDAEALRLMRLAATAGNAEAQNELGVFYRDGRGVARSDAEAVRLFRLAADQGYPPGQWDLGWMYQTGRGVTQSYAEAVRLYRLAADQGNPGGQFRLAILYKDGHGVAQSDAEAARLYRLAADQGYPAAAHDLGLMYLNGLGVAQSDTEAALLFRAAADKGNLDAQKTLGDLYLHGRGVPRSSAEAVSWYQRAARSGYKDAQLALKALGQSW